jgi:polyketide synthase PksN
MSAAVIELAKIGFFFENSYEVETVSESQSGVNRLARKVNLIAPVKKAFCIRVAEENDLDVLSNIEEDCWGALRVSKEEIVRRLRAFPRGQWVATIDSEVQGVIYTQRISSLDSFDGSSVNVDNQGCLHAADNPVLQLMTVSVLPGKARFQLGSSLRNFVVLLGRLDSTVVGIAAVTRCARAASILQSSEEYNHFVFSNQDPIIQFHLSAGAEIIQVVPNYRKMDVENYSNGILLVYNVNHSGTDVPMYTPLSAPSTPASCGGNPAFDTEQSFRGILSPLFHRSGFTPLSIKSSSPKPSLPPSVDYWGQLRSVMLETCQLTSQRDKLASMDSLRLMESSFMDLGYDSLDLIVMRSKIAELLQCDLPNTALFDFPTPKSLLKRISSGFPFDVTVDSRQNSSDGGEHEFLDQFAICGLGCRFPGQKTPQPSSFYDFLCANQSAVSSVPDEWKTATRHAAFLDVEFAESFDPQFFGISVSEAEGMDPNQRLLLEVCHEALQASNGGSDRHEEYVECVKQRTGVFVGLSSNDWNTFHSKSGAYSSTGLALSIAANRVSYAFNLGGPSMVIDTACSSSFSALHMACNSIRVGDCDTAVVAASDLILSEFALEVKNLINSGLL